MKRHACPIRWTSVFRDATNPIQEPPNTFTSFNNVSIFSDLHLFWIISFLVRFMLSLPHLCVSFVNHIDIKHSHFMDRIGFYHIFLLSQIISFFDHFLLLCHVQSRKSTLNIVVILIQRRMIILHNTFSIHNSSIIFSFFLFSIFIATLTVCMAINDVKE